MALHQKRAMSFPTTIHPEEWMWSLRKPRFGVIFSWLYQIVLLVALGFLGYYFASRQVLQSEGTRRALPHVTPTIQLAPRSTR